MGAEQQQLELYVEGNRVIARASFRVPAEEDGTLTDPTTVTFTLRRHGSSTTTSYLYGTAVEVERESQGIYTFTSEPDDGTWTVKALGTGAAHGAAKRTFRIEP